VGGMTRFLRRARDGQLSGQAVDRATLIAAIGGTLGWVFYRSLPASLVWLCIACMLALPLALLPSYVSGLQRDWRAGTSAKHRARILSAHARELDELTAELRAKAAAFDAIRHRLEAGDR